MPVNIPVKAGGDINPARFVTLSTSANFTVTQAGANAAAIGVSQENTKDTPDSGGSTLAAESGDMVRVFFPGEDPLLKIGVGGCTAGDFLKSDASGQGVTASTTNDIAVARAFETASAGELAKVLMIDPYYVQ